MPSRAGTHSRRRRGAARLSAWLTSARSDRSEERWVDSAALLLRVGAFAQRHPTLFAAADEPGASWFGVGEHVRAGVGPAVLSAGLAPEREACFAGEAGSVCPPGSFLTVGSELVPLTVGDRVVYGAEDVVGEQRCALPRGEGDGHGACHRVVGR